MSSLSSAPKLATPSERRALAPADWQSRLGFRLDWLWPLAAALTGLAIQSLRPTNHDVSWLLTVNDKILAGGTAYRDIIELNPPGSILLYRLPALVGRMLSIPAEFVVQGMLAALICAVLIFAQRLMSRYALSSRASNNLFLGALAFVLAILPFDDLAQREHLATIFIIPFAFVALARQGGGKVLLWESLISGMMLGLCIAIKPYFALCALLVFAAQFKRQGVGAVRNLEYWAAAAVALAYVAVALLWFPAFFSDTLPLIADLYLPVRLDMVKLVQRMVLSTFVPLSICWIYRTPRAHDGAAVFLLIAAGFFGAYLIQGKGWPYHAYPVITFCLIAAAWTIQQQASHESTPWWRSPGMLLLATAMLWPLPRFYQPEASNPALEAAISKIAPHPKISSIGFSINLGHPTVRDVGGVWVGRMWGLWATGGALLMKERFATDPAMRAKAESYFEGDRLMLTQDIETQRPDIILVEKLKAFDWFEWAAGSPRLQAALDKYELADSVGDVAVLKLKNGPNG